MNLRAIDMEVRGTRRLRDMIGRLTERFTSKEIDRWIEVIYHVYESTRRVYPTEETWETGSNARLTARQSQTAYECLRVGLRVSDRTGRAKRSIVLERRRWLKRKLDRPLGLRDSD
jgi:hypothetical protein